jgi:fucose permease
MKKANTEIVWLVLFSLLTAGIGQALLHTAAAPLVSQLTASSSARAQPSAS